MDVFDIVILEFDRTGADSPAAGLQRVFPIDQGTALRLLNALPVTVKRRVPQAAAEQYRSALTAIGARVELRKVDAPHQAPEPPPPAAAPPAAAAPLIAPARFAGASTLKHGSPIGSPAPLAIDAAYMPTDRPPAPAPSSASAVAVAAAPQAVASVRLPTADTVAAVPAPTEKWGGLAGAPRPDAHAGTLVAAAPTSEREANQRELLRRLSGLDQPESTDERDGEAAGGISVLELDLPSPRADWAGLVSPRAATVAATAPRGASLEADNDAPLELDSGRAPEVARVELAASPPRVQVSAQPADNRSFGEALPDAIALSLRDGGARWVGLGSGIAFATAVVLWLLRGHSVLAACVGTIASIAILALASEQAAAALRAVVDDLGSPDSPDLRVTDIGRYTSAGFNLLCFALVSHLPFLSWLSSHRDQLPGAFLDAPLGLALLLVSASYWPMAVGQQAISENALAVWSLPRGLRAIGNALADYLTLALTFVVLCAAPVALTLAVVRLGLPAEFTFFGIGLGVSLSHGAIGALMGHIGRLHPRVFAED